MAFITLTSDQIQRFEAIHTQRWILKVLEQYFPLLYRKLSSELSQEFAAIVSEKIKTYELRTTYAQRGYVRIAAVAGSRFDEDPVALEPGLILTKSDTGCISRIIKLHQWVASFQEEVYGSNYEHYLAALRRTAEFTFEKLSATSTPQDVIEYGRMVFPSRAIQLTESGEWTLYQNCYDYLTHKGMSSNGDLGLLLMTYGISFLLGFGSLDDPLHDFVRKIIESENSEKVKTLFEYSNKRVNAEIRIMQKNIPAR